MKAIRTSSRWLLLIAGISWGLLQLNGAAYAAWLSGGPPTPNPEGWLFVAGNRLAWAVAAFLAAFGLFLLLRSKRPVSRYAIAMLVAALLLTAFPYFREYAASGACIDSGGQWSDLHCIHGPAPAA